MVIKKTQAYFKNNIECCSKSMEQYNLHKELKECLKRVSEVCPPDNLADCIKKDLNLKVYNNIHRYTEVFSLF